MALGPNRAPERYDVPPSNGAPRTTTSAAAIDAASARSTGSTPRKVMSGPYIAPYRVIAGRTSSLLDVPRRAVVGQEVEERNRVEGLRSEHAGAFPLSRGDELERHERVDRRLPDDGLRTPLAHALLVVG